MKNATKVGVWCGSLQIEQEDGDTTTNLRVRRVKRDGREEVQIEVCASKSFPTRTTRCFGGLSLTPEVAALLVTALTKVHPSVDVLRRHNWRAPRDFWQSFYGIGTKEPYPDMTPIADDTGGGQ